MVLRAGRHLHWQVDRVTYSATVVFDPRRLKQTSTWRKLRNEIYPPEVSDAEVFEVLLELITRGPA